MKPAPPVTSTRIAERLLIQKPREALTQAVAPVRQLGGALLGAEHRVRRAMGPRAELLSRDAADAALDAGVFEDRLREVRPRAVAARGHVVDAERQLGHRRHRGPEMTDV